MRAQLYWGLRDALNPMTGDPIELPPDDEMAEDLAAAEFEVTLQGIRIESKDDIKKRLGRSPDKGDAVLLGWEATDRAVRTRAKTDAIRGREDRRGTRTINRQYGKVAGR